MLLTHQSVQKPEAPQRIASCGTATKTHQAGGTLAGHCRRKKQRSAKHSEALTNRQTVVGIALGCSAFCVAHSFSRIIIRRSGVRIPEAPPVLVVTRQPLTRDRRWLFCFQPSPAGHWRDTATEQHRITPAMAHQIYPACGMNRCQLKSGPKSVVADDRTPTLSDVGISKDLSSRVL